MLYNPTRKSCRTFFQLSHFNTPQITTSKFLMLRCESCLAPARFHLPGKTLRASSGEQQVPASPQQDRLWAEGKGHSLSTSLAPGLPGRMREGQTSSFHPFSHPHFQTQDMSVMLFIKKRQDKATTRTQQVWAEI